jgi:hypothetical protein
VLESTVQSECVHRKYGPGMPCSWSFVTGVGVEGRNPRSDGRSVTEVQCRVRRVPPAGTTDLYAGTMAERSTRSRPGTPHARPRAVVLSVKKLSGVLQLFTVETMADDGP